MKPVEIEFFIDNKTKPGVNEMISGFDKTADRADALQKKIAMVEKQLSELQQQAEKGIDIGAAGTESVDVLRNKLVRLQDELKKVNSTAVRTTVIPPELPSAKTKFNGLNMSIQQIARELPSLAMGPQMFFLAISNNLPIFTDQLALARKEFQAMKAAGEEAIPVWKQVLSSIVSWQTLLAVGITLSVTYGKEIGNWVKSIFSGKSALDDFSESMKDFNAEVIKQQSNALLLFDAVKKTGEGTELRRKAIEQINDAYGKYLPYLLNEKSTLEEIYEAYKLVNSAILENAALKAQQKEIDESTENSISKQTKIIETLRERLKKIAPKLSEEDINNYVLSIRKSIENYLSKGYKSNEAAMKVFSDLLPDRRFLLPREIDFTDTLKKYSYEIAKYYATINSIRQKYKPFLNNTAAVGASSTATEEIDRLTSRISTLKKEISELRNGTISAGAGQTVDKAIAAKESEIRQAEESLRRLTGISASDKKEADKDAEYLLKTNKEVQRKIEDNNIAMIKDRYEREREAAWVEFQREKTRIQEEETERLALYNKLRKNGADISPDQELDIIANAIVQNMQAEQIYVQTYNKINREEEEEAKKKYDKLLATYRDYVDKRIAINAKYDEDIAALEAGKNESNAAQVERSISEANRMRQKELENIDREISRTAVEGSKILQDLFSRAAVQSKKEIAIAISDAEKLLRLLKGESISGNLGFTDEQISAMKKDGALIEKILQGIIAKKEQLYAKKGTFSRFAADLKELRNALSMDGGDKKTDRINSALKSTLSTAQEIGQAFGDVAGRLSQIAELSGDSRFQEIADVLSNTSAFFNSAVSGAVSGMQLGGVGGAIAGGILSGGLSLLSMAFESSARHKAALKEVQQAEIAYQRQFNLLLLEQNMLLKEANTIFGTDKIQGAIQMVQNYGKALNDLKDALKGNKPEEVIFGKGDFSNYAQQLRDYRTGIEALNKKDTASQKDGSKSVWDTVIVSPSGSALKQQQEQLNKQAADAQNQRLSAYQKQMEAYNAGYGALNEVDIVTGHKKTGLFGWGKGRDTYTNILDMEEYEGLVQENGRLRKDMLQSILDTRKMKDEARATLEYLLELENALDEAEEQLSNYLSDTFGALGQGIMDSVTSALNGSENALQNFADDTAGVLENLGEQIAYSLYFAAAFEELQRQLKELYMSEDKAEVIGKKAQDLIGDFYAGIGGQIEGATAWLEEWKRYAAEKGFNLWPSDTASQKGQAGAFQTLTQDQGTKLEGLFTALQMHAASIDIKLDNATAGLANALILLQEIKANTDSIPSIYRELMILKRDGMKLK